MGFVDYCELYGRVSSVWMRFVCVEAFGLCGIKWAISKSVDCVKEGRLCRRIWAVWNSVSCVEGIRCLE